MTIFDLFSFTDQNSHKEVIKFEFENLIDLTLLR